MEASFINIEKFYGTYEKWRNIMKVDIVIPTYHPDQRFVKTIEMLLKQQIQPEHIWIVNTEEKFWIQEIEHMSPKIHVTHIK